MVDKFTFVRKLAGQTVSVVAERVERMEVYAAIVRVNGVLFEARYVDDVWSDAQRMIEAAFLESIQLQELAVDTINKLC